MCWHGSIVGMEVLLAWKYCWHGSIVDIQFFGLVRRTPGSAFGSEATLSGTCECSRKFTVVENAP